MKVYDVEQGSVEWHALHIGIPTASNFHRILTPKTLEFSKQARPYAFRLAAEVLLGQPFTSDVTTEWMDGGKENEPKAIEQYEMVYGVETKKIGFVTTDDGRWGCSPDRFIVGQNAAVEVKCPSPPVHLAYWYDGPDEKYTSQVQGQIEICDLEWDDFYSFNERMPPAVRRTVRNGIYVKQLVSALNSFCELRDAILERARSTGFFERRPVVMTPTEIAVESYSDAELSYVIGA